jgi:hypothetical protein
MPRRALSHRKIINYHITPRVKIVSNHCEINKILQVLDEKKHVNNALIHGINFYGNRIT